MTPGPSLPPHVRKYIAGRYAEAKRVEDYCLLYLSGIRTPEIARQFGTYPTNVAQTLRRAGITLSKRGAPKKASA
jgi:hypothetical protein